MSITPQRAETDLCLLRRIAGHDRSALSELYDHYSPLLYPLMLHIIGEAGEAGRNIRTLFVAIWESRAIFDPTFGTPESWLTRLARDHAVARRRELPSRDIAVQFAGSAPVLEGLTERQKQLLAAAYYGGATLAELAERFSLEEGSVRQELRDGMTELRKKVQHRA